MINRQRKSPIKYLIATNIFKRINSWCITYLQIIYFKINIIFVCKHKISTLQDRRTVYIMIVTIIYKENMLPFWYYITGNKSQKGARLLNDTQYIFLFCIPLINGNTHNVRMTKSNDMYLITFSVAFVDDRVICYELQVCHNTVYLNRLH